MRRSRRQCLRHGTARMATSPAGRGAHWLFRIRTQPILKIICTRSRRPRTTTQICHLQPYPDRLLDRPADTDTDTDDAAIVERRERGALAFITALRLLPEARGLVLILRDVLDWSAVEVADLFDVSVPAVNGAAPAPL